MRFKLIFAARLSLSKVSSLCFLHLLKVLEKGSGIAKPNRFVGGFTKGLSGGSTNRLICFLKP